MNPGQPITRTIGPSIAACTESELAFLTPTLLLSSYTITTLNSLPRSVITQYPIHSRFTEHAIRWTLQQLKFDKDSCTYAVKSRLFTKARIRQTSWTSGPLAGTSSYDITIKGEKRSGTRPEEVLAIDYSTFRGALLPYSSRGCVQKERLTAEAKVGRGGSTALVCIDTFIRAGKRPDPLAAAKTAPLFVPPFPLLRIEVETATPRELKAVKEGKCSWNSVYQSGIDLSAPEHRILSHHFGNSRLARNGITDSARRALAHVCAQLYPTDHRLHLEGPWRQKHLEEHT